MPNLNFGNLYNDYWVVMEQTTPEDSKIETLKIEDGDLKYLRFRACLQDFGARNRNKRLWKLEHIKPMLEMENVTEMMNTAGGWPGEAGHPVPLTGQVTLERIATIDPNNVSHFIKSLSFEGNRLYGIIDTADDGEGSPGRKLMNNILQGIIAAFSLRSLVPQRKNPDGTIDVLGPGRAICYDRVYLPSHKSAYMTIGVPVKNIVTKNKFETVMESFTDFVMEKSEIVKNIIDTYEPAIENYSMDSKTGMVSAKVKDYGTLFIRPEAKFTRELSDFMKGF